MKTAINVAKRFIRFVIKDTIWLLQNFEKLKTELKNYYIDDVRPYRFARWHSGFNYFRGTFKNEPVFIKICCGEWDTVLTEANLLRIPKFKNHPPVIAYNVAEHYSWIATKFENLTPLNNCSDKYDINILIERASCVLDDLYNNGIIHRDLRPENICVDENENIILIDFGWALYESEKYEKTNYNFIEEILNCEYRDSSGRFDDALSMYFAFKESFKNISENDLKPIRDRVGRLTI